jgi:GH15 family glucan-1,4-alpha-glucosidase
LSYLLAETPFLLETPCNLLFGPDETLREGVAEITCEFQERTDEYWREWSRRLALPLEWQDAVIRAAIILKRCQFEDTGAIVAALTTSIPEAPNSGRNWDYCYCWLRDVFFVVRALNRLSEMETLEHYLCWLANVIVASSGEDRLQPVYGLALERTLP